MEEKDTYSLETVINTLKGKDILIIYFLMIKLLN